MSDHNYKPIIRKFKYLILTARLTFNYLITVVTGATELYTPEIVPGGVSGDAVTTRYWDCCKPSCSWKENIPKNLKRPINSCLKDGRTAANIELQTGCDQNGGTTYMCNNQQPWAVNSTFAYGFAGASFKGGADISYCCACFLLKFKGQLAGKSMVVQWTNTGADALNHHFDLSIPGGGVGYNTIGCMRQWNAGSNGWGDRYGGVHSRAECNQLPKQLQKGCQFRFDFMNGVSNPDVSFTQVTCPHQIVSVSGCA